MSGITQETIARINELAKKSRTETGLTEEELLEQKELRSAYIAAFRSSLKSQLDSTTVVNPDGTSYKLTQKNTKN